MLLNWCCRREEVVQLRVGARLVDRSYAGVMGCGGYMLEHSPLEDIAPQESPMMCQKRLSCLKEALGAIFSISFSPDVVALDRMCVP
jgi:hypothetical protein